WSASTLSTQRQDDVAAGLQYAPLYYVAACSRSQAALDALPGLSLFGDAEQSVYSHYEHEIRKNMGAGHRILELEAQLTQERSKRALLEQRLAALSSLPGQS